jgi:hypothetical protein
MKPRWATIILTLLAVGLSGCGQTAPPAPAPVADATAAAPATEPAADSSFPAIPPNAAYTLMCLNIMTPTHIPDSERLKMQLIRKTGLRDWYVVHGEGQSTLYFGFYSTYFDSNQPEEKLRAQNDRKMIAQLKDDVGNQPFLACAFQPIATPDPPAPPEWDLHNATGYWTLHVGSYTDSPDRKKFAVEAVRQARALGIEAYYFHGPTVSDVLIGNWPREAVKQQDTSVAASNDPNKTIIVTNQPLPAGYDPNHVFTKDGRPAKVFYPRLEVQDPTLLEMMHQYPANAVNGQVFMHKVQTDHGLIDVPDPSFLVAIPHDETDDTAGQ